MKILVTNKVINNKILYPIIEVILSAKELDLMNIRDYENDYMKESTF